MASRVWDASFLLGREAVRLARIPAGDEDMRGQVARLRMPLWLALMLMPLLGVSASTSALPADVFDIDVPGPVGRVPDLRLGDASATPVPAGEVGMPPPSIRREAVRGNPLWAIPLAALSTTRERPIFAPSRRPPPPVVVAAPESPMPPPPSPPPKVELHLSLVGTVSGGDQSFGLFIDQASKAVLRLKVGEYYQDWRLRSVHGREAILVHGELSETLKFPRPGEGPLIAGYTLAESAARRHSSHTPDYD